MRLRCSSISAFLILALPVYAEDWEKIALETDEPSFGLLVEEVESGSAGEDLGIERGDFLTQLDEAMLRQGKLAKDSEGKALFFVKSGGRASDAVIEGSDLGITYHESFRPWIGWLRGEIGTEMESEKERIVEVLSIMEQRPEEALSVWQAVREAGYPEDELDAFVRAFCAWRSGRPAPVREAFERIHDEFEIFPMVYYDRLEDMAFATHQTEVLRKLRELDPPTSLVSESLIAVWDQLQRTDPDPIDLIEKAASMRGRDVTDEIVVPDGAKEGTRPTSILRNSRPFRIKPGFYRHFRGLVPEGVEDFHAVLECRIVCHDHHERWASLARLGLYAPESEERGGIKSSLVAQIGVGDQITRGPYVLIDGGMNSGGRAWFEPNFDLAPAEGEGRRPSQPPRRIEIIKLGGEVATFVDGIQYMHLPVPDSLRTFHLNFHVSGLELAPMKFHLWELVEPQ